MAVSKFHFYQQIRLMLRELRDGKTSDESLLDEKLRIVSTLSLDAPDGHIESIHQAEKDVPIEITVWNNGLTGAMGALPTAYSEWMIERYYRYSDHSAKAFIDLFGHRLYCLDYLAWQKHHIYAQAESGTPLPLQTAILALAGLLQSSGEPGLAFHAHIFSSPVRSMVNLERWLHQIYNVPVKIIPFTGGWRPVADAERCRLGDPSQTLKTAPVMGNVRLEIHSHFDVVLGPMSPEMSCRFIQHGSEWKNLWVRIREYVGPAVDFSVSLAISTTGLQPHSLGTSALGLDLCLGHNTSSHSHHIRLPPPSI
jgi:type VI secretion system protein ImpH